jgi:outer membrane protein assembly factor BamA
MPSAQFPVVPERCAESPHPHKSLKTWRRVVIERVDFDSPTHVNQSEVAQSIQEANHTMMDADDPQWINEFADDALRELWLDRGFFNAHVTAESHSLSRNSTMEKFLVAAHVEEGLQYRLQGIRFGGDKTDVPETELRAAFPISDGELFDVSRIRKGIEALTNLFGSLGYIDFSAVPDTRMNDDSRQISVVLQLDLQKQFRVGKVEILTVNPKLEARLRELLRTGEVFHSGALDAFCKENRSALPKGFSSRDVHTRRNARTGILDLSFDLRVCQ